MKIKKTVAFICMLILSAFIVCGAFSGCSKKKGSDTVDMPEQEEEQQEEQLNEYKPEYQTAARHGYYTQYCGTVNRNIPSATQDGGLFAYPKYGYTLGMNQEQKSALTAESSALCGKATKNATGTYDKIDCNGYLYLSDNTPVLDSGGNHRKLYKHTAAAGMYLGDVSDDEPGVIKRITFKPRSYSNSYGLTGLYAPAGEVIKVEISKSDFEAVGKGLTFHIGQCLYNGQNNNIWEAKNYNRMAVIMNTLVFNESNSVYNEQTNTYTCYIGSYLGGPIYVRSANKTFTLTITGAVNYRHFILGHTTKQEYEELCNSSAPYFDLEVWDNGVLHSGPLYYAKNYTYDDIFKAAELWEKISLVSTNVRGQGIVFLYDSFVAAGAAVAFPGRASVNCPMSWMASALNYKSFENSGAWGVMHEYNHNFQGWGLSGGGEVTNNALNIASYAAFTKISAARTLTDSGEGGLSGWNAYTSASWSLRRVISGIYGGTNQLSVYSTLIHNFGPKDFVIAAKRSGDNYYTDLCNATGYDLTYYFKNMISQSVGDGAVNAVKAKNLPVFVPVACVYQTGRGLINSAGEKRYVKTVMPFTIKYGQDFIIDLSPYTVGSDGYYKGGSIVMPNGFTYTVKSVSAPQYGSIKKSGENTYVYTPDKKELSSGDIKVTLSVTKQDAEFKVEDIELLLEFTQTHETNKNMLERTVYTFNTLPNSAKEAYESKYAGYVSKTESDNVNPVQNSNADIWAPTPVGSVMEVRGKLYVPTDGDYRLALRGRKSCALYVNAGGKNKNYELAAELTNSTVNTFHSEPSTYHDFENVSAGSWIYFKEVLLVDYASAFIGLGWGRIEREGGTIDSDNSENTTEVVPTVTLSYPTAYRSTYEFPSGEFESPYLFTRAFTATYNGSKYYSQKGTLVSAEGYTPWAGYMQGLGELFDDNDNNFIHSAKGVAYDITEQTPFDITVDLGSVINVNKMTIYGEPSRQYQPKDFTLYGGTDIDGLKKICSVTDALKTGNNVVVSFSSRRIRYYRLVCTQTYANNPAGSKYIAYRCIKFDYEAIISGGVHLTPADARLTYKGNWSIKNAVSTFGRIYEGESGATCEFSFNGSRFAISSFVANDYDSYDIYVDGALYTTVYLNGSYNEVRFAFMSNVLNSGEHTVKIVCNGKINVDSVLYK